MVMLILLAIVKDEYKSIKKDEDCIIDFCAGKPYKKKK